MAYASWSVVFGEQPSAAKWNILGTNDASFNDGTGISGPINSMVYKFSAYRNGALTPGADTNIIFDTEDFDTNSNHSTSTGIYTAPVNGFYQLQACVSASGTPTTYFMAALMKNGSIWKYGNAPNGDATPQSTVGDLVQLTAGDTVSIQAHMGSSVALVVGRQQTYFSGFLVTRT